MGGIALDTTSETHRRECEARAVMRMAKDERTRFYDWVRQYRGDDAAHDLVAEVNRQWHLLNQHKE